MKKFIEWLKAKANKERSVLIGAVVTLLWYGSDVVVSSDYSDWRALVPFVTGAFIRVFVTSENVEPGWRRKP